MMRLIKTSHTIVVPAGGGQRSREVVVETVKRQPLKATK